MSRIVHDSVPGRVRLAIEPLRHNTPLAIRLEALLRREPTITEVRASIWSGNLLVRFRPPLTAAEIGQLVERALDPLRSTEPESTPVEQPALPVVSQASDDGKDWSRESAEAAMTAFGGDGVSGLSDAAAAAALRRWGANAFATQHGRPWTTIFREQVASLPTALLAGSAVLSLATGGILDAALILGVIALNTGLGYTTESKAERMIASLGVISQPEASVLRNGVVHHVPTEAVVPGDILVLAPGHLVAADARLIACRDLTIDEALLTGESVPVRKSVDAIAAATVALGDRTCMVFKGTAVTGGSGRAVVVATGPRTELGRIQRLAASARPPETPKQRQLDEMSRQLVWGSLACVGGMVGLGLLRGLPPLALVKSAASLAVAALPEGLSTVATVTMALGIRDMARDHAAVRRLDAIETLGSVQTVCFDKTGTLTLNRMAVDTVLVDGREHRFAAGTPAAQAADEDGLRQLLAVGVLCSDADVTAQAGGGFRVTGSATESALIHVAIDTGLDPVALREAHPLISMRARSETRRFMATRHQKPGGETWVAVKGSPADVLRLANKALVDGATVPLDAAMIEHLTAENERLAAEGLRVLGFAEAMMESGDSEPDYVWLGLVGLADPVRPEMRALLGRFHAAGIRTVMITGDQTATAYAIARQVDLSKGEPVEILEGRHLDELDPKVLAALADKTHVFARVGPAHKLQIVQALQHSGQVVAMTGDGINDSPALRAADIGIAMGTGTEAAREASDLVLTDDALPTMVTAVERGRAIYQNVRKSIRFLLATNSSEILVELAAVGLRLGEPLTPVQLLWINLAPDVAPAIALALDPPEEGLMAQPPRDPQEPILRSRDFATIAREGAVITLAALGGYGYGRRRFPGVDGPRGMAFMTLTLAQLFHALASRSETRTMLSTWRTGNRPLAATVAGLVGLQLLGALLPGTRRILGTAALRPQDVAAACAIAASALVANETLKGVLASPSLPAAGLSEKDMKGPEEGANR